MICFPFDSKNIGSEQDPVWDRAITSKMERELNKLTWTNGVFMSPVDSLLVSAGSGLRVKVAKGGCHIEGARGYQETDKYLSLSRGTSQPRIDRVVVRFDNSENERNIDIHIKEGTPSAAPAAPELVRQSNIYELALADIKVKAGASSIEAVDITDLRANAKVCGFVLPAIPVKQPTDKLWSQINESIKTVESALNGTALGDVRKEIVSLKSDIESKTRTLEARLQQADTKLQQANSRIAELTARKPSLSKEDHSTTRLATLSSTWTAPADGLLLMRVEPKGSERIGIHYVNCTSMTNPTQVASILCHAGAQANALIPVRKGYRYECTNSTYISLVNSWFFEFK